MFLLAELESRSVPRSGARIPETALAWLPTCILERQSDAERGAFAVRAVASAISLCLSYFHHGRMLGSGVVSSLPP